MNPLLGILLACTVLMIAIYAVIFVVGGIVWVLGPERRYYKENRYQYGSEEKSESEPEATHPTQGVACESTEQEEAARRFSRFLM